MRHIRIAIVNARANSSYLGLILLLQSSVSKRAHSGGEDNTTKAIVNAIRKMNI